MRSAAKPEARVSQQGVTPASTNLAGLGNRLVSIFARRLPRLDFAAEVARVVHEAMRVTAVAILGYEVRRERLVLLAAEGLNTEAIAALGGGEACLWDIPMRSARNHRISIITDAHKNPFVPRALADVARLGLTIVALPVLQNEQPAGVVLLFAAGRRQFSDADLYTLSQALLVCAPVLRDASQGAAETPPITIENEKVQEALAKLAAAGAIIDPGAASPASAPAVEPPLWQDTGTSAAHAVKDFEAERRGFEEELNQLRQELDQANARVRQLTLNTHSLQRERDELLAQLHQRESEEAAEIARLRAEVESLQDRLVASEAERTRAVRLAEGRIQALQQSLNNLQREWDALQSRSGGAEAQLAEWQTLAMAVFEERDRLAAQIESLHAQRRNLEEEVLRLRQEAGKERAALEADRDAWKTEAEAARQQLVERTKKLGRLESELRSTMVQRDALAEQLVSLRAEWERASRIAEEIHAQFADSETARAAAMAENQLLRQALDEERQRSADAAAALTAELNASRQEADSLARLVDSLRVQLDQQERLARSAQEAWDTLHAQYTAAQTELERLRGELDGHEAARVEIATRLEHLQEERDAMVRERRALLDELSALRRQLTEVEAAKAALAAELQARTAEAERELQRGKAEALQSAERAERLAAELREAQLQLQRAAAQSKSLSSTVSELSARLDDALVERQRLVDDLRQREASWRQAEEARQAVELRWQQERQRREEEQAFWQERWAAAEQERDSLLQQLVAREQELQARERTLEQLNAELDYWRHQSEQAREQSKILEQALKTAHFELEASRKELEQLRSTMDEERSRAETLAQSLRAELSTVRSEAQVLAEQLRRAREQQDAWEQAARARDAEIERWQREVARLRQQLADRAVLAAQAESLAARVVELEAELAAARAELEHVGEHTASEWEQRVIHLEKELARVRGEAEQAERARAALADEILVARNLVAQTQVAADRRTAALQATIERLEATRRELENALALRTKELEQQAARVAAAEAAAEERQREYETARHDVAELQERLSESKAQFDSAMERARQLEQELQQAQFEKELAASAAQEIERAHAETMARATELEARLRAVETELANQRAAWERERQHTREQWQEKEQAQQAQLRELEVLRGSVNNLRAELAALEAQRDAALARATEAEQALSERIRELEARAVGAETMLQQAQAAISELQVRLAQRERALEEALQRREELESEGLRHEERYASLAAENARLEEELAKARASQGEQVQSLARELQRVRTEHRALQQEKALLEGALAEHQKRTRDLAQAHASTVGELQGVVEHLRKQIAELNQGRAQLNERLEHAERELTKWRDEAQRRGLEQATLVERLRSAEEQLALAEQRRLDAERQLQQLRNDVEAWQQRWSAQQSQIAAAQETEERLAAVLSELDHLRGELARSERERELLQAEIERAAQERAEVLADLEAERLRLQEQLRQLGEERRRVEGLLAEQQAALDQQRGLVAELRASYEQLQADKLATESECAELAAALEEARTKLAELEERLNERERALARVEQEREELVEALRFAQEAASKSPLGNGPAAGAGVVTVTAAELEKAVPKTARDAGATVTAGEHNGVAAGEAVRELFVLDGGRRADEASAALRAAGFEVRVVAPNDDAVRHLSPASSGCVLINLGAGPQAWRALLKLRSERAWSAWRVLAYVVPPNGEKGFCFGRAEFDLWPLDAERLLASLNWLRPKVKKVLAVSADVDSMNKLREPLTKAGISTSIVLDGKQALEFTNIIAPEATALHLSPATPGAARALATLRQQENTSDLPLLIALDRAPSREEHFYASTARELLLKGSFTFKALPSALASLLA
ncbi:MAG: hypothetical protein KatS3mg077_3322 [Candidatus Binatia bacterium]|nr:MAG: hypothetical protein KatS3mg077_3322 [Candidatus Binatia bacterium]